MGSASLTMAVLAGLVPELQTVVACAVSLHIDLNEPSRRRLKTLMPATALVLRGTDPQWAARAPSVAAAGLARWARLGARSYANPVTAATTYFYGGLPEALWRRGNLDEPTFAWLTREFGYAPFSFFKQIRRCSDAGHLVPVDGLPELPRDLLAAQPPQGTRFMLLTGAQNQFFLPGGQRRTYEHFEAMQPGRHKFLELEGYSHIDLLVGRQAAHDVFPRILSALNDGAF
jgi:hypothetical protein